jgi:hypothetical protein
MKQLGIIGSIAAILIISFVLGAASQSLKQNEIPEQKTGITAELPVFYSNHDLVDTLYFCGEALPMNELDVFERFERDFLINVNDRTQIVMYLKRAGRFFPYIEKRLEEAGLPDDIKYLAVAESALLNVRSPAGAAGFWQIMPRVGRSYGLIVDGAIDERYNLEKSTDVAIAYLKKSYKKFNSWALAAASYNMGVYGTNDELGFQGEDSYYDLWLNRETARYLFRIMAIKEVMENHEAYGYKDVIPYKPIPQENILIKSPIGNMALWAKKQGLSYKHVKLLNPWIRSRKIPAYASRQDGFKIAVPESINSLTNGVEYAYGDEQDTIEGGIYVVKAGETLQSIANKCGLSVAELRLKNRIKEDDELYPGMKLKVMP